MIESKKFELTRIENGIGLEGDIFKAVDDEGKPLWDLISLDRDRMILRKKGLSHLLSDIGSAIGSCDVDVLTGLLFGLNLRRFSGVILIDTGRGIKKLYFRNGEVCFAASNMIDDRLGEVIYRADMIKLDEMTDSAVKVNRNTKFGKVLLNSAIFTTIDLWRSLKVQVSEIIRSVFLVNNVYFEVQEGIDLAPTSVVFEQGTAQIIEELAGFGSMFRSFLLRISADSSIRICDQCAEWVEPENGTFLKDFFDMIRNANNVSELVSLSKLKDINTYVYLFQLINQRLIEVEFVDDGDLVVGFDSDSSGIKSKVDAYHILLKLAKRAFEEEKVEFPINDMQRFSKSLSLEETSPLFLDANAEISRDSLNSVFKQCGASKTRADRIRLYLESNINFLLQISGDLLSGGKGRAVKDAYYELVK